MTIPYNDRELEFCRNIVAGMTGTDAAIAAGYAPSNASTQSNRLLKKAKIQLKIEELRGKNDSSESSDSEESTECSERELRFCENVANGLPGTAAAIQAGYAESGAGAQANRLMKRDRIVAKIEELREQRRVKAEIDSTRVIKEIAAIAFHNVLDLFDNDWQLVDKKVVKPSMARAIRSVQVVERKNSKGVVVERKVTARMHDKLRALDHLAVQLGLKLNDAQAIAALLKYGEVERTPDGVRFQYKDLDSAE